MTQLATRPIESPVEGVAIDRVGIMRSLNLNPTDPKTQALLLICDRYELDPILKHVVLIQGTAYVTRDGYLAVAHRSGVFDGMEVVEQGETDTHYTAKVAVHRKDMKAPFTYVGRFPKNKPMAKDYGPEMAVKCAEVQALRRAFNVTGVGAADERWDDAAIPPEKPDNVGPAKGALPAAPAVAEPAPEAARIRRPPGSAQAEQPAPETAQSEEPVTPVDRGFDIQPTVDAIEEMGPRLKKAVMETWKTKGWGSTKPGAKKPLTKEDADAAWQFVTDEVTAMKDRAKRIAIACKEVGLETDAERHALVAYATSNATESGKDVTEAEVHAVLEAAKELESGALVLNFTEDGEVYFAPAPGDAA